ncbi:MAG TPA: WbuC family cupin fold metalloprotein [Rhodocyclaceae bacterium]|jgi:cupin fold WbuC family metalloprotein|nr:WbuC family cupin fold metalloprotein [Rhodocyclaceae bacterium]
MKLIDINLLDDVSAEAVASPRQRKNHNLHPHNEFPAHRLLNAVEPGSYIVPHRHLDALKDETMVVLRGSFGLVIFDDVGTVVRTERIAADGEVLGVDIPHGTWHSLVSLAPGSVFLEAKAGPYALLTEAERARWAPAEGDAEAPAYYARLAALFA